VGVCANIVFRPLNATQARNKRRRAAQKRAAAEAKAKEEEKEEEKKYVAPSRLGAKWDSLAKKVH
jgi:ribosomal protein L12E/L44/L45/RPP1/RPP2